MRCPSLMALPRSPVSSPAGWPWNEESPTATDRGLPRITVITPSFNQAHYLEETIRSVLLQGYPDLEYFVVDGGSTDGSVEILRRYDTWISWWCSEADGGQADALNKALRRATGTVMNWVNSDDRLEPGALQLIGRHFDESTDAVAASCRFLHEPGGEESVSPNRGLEARRFIVGSPVLSLCQPSLWLRTDGVREVGGFNVESHYYFDSELFTRYLARWPRVQYRPEVTSTFRIHESSKTGSSPDEFRKEYVRALRRLAMDAPTRDARVIAAGRLQELELHARFLTLSNERSRVRRVAEGARLTARAVHPTLLRVSVRWMLSLVGLLQPPLGEVPEIEEIRLARGGSTPGHG